MCSENRLRVRGFGGRRVSYGYAYDDSAVRESVTAMCTTIRWSEIQLRLQRFGRRLWLENWLQWLRRFGGRRFDTVREYYDSAAGDSVRLESTTIRRPEARLLTATTIRCGQRLLRMAVTIRCGQRISYGHDDSMRGEATYGHDDSMRLEAPYGSDNCDLVRESVTATAIQCGQ
ncbi:hypothetical protein BJ508DRAFT_313248 [Ascobolus immersus RN42]|uniref:Uncharacterized protein n=1 Tax=Ascobolus immersus RN42 TaxID=1160509 RepID=A0A3N4HQI0_ASCIM|nr:hypothetical protein BJ508DRAFT_313248 [Ascobolus immersus RN42]